MFYIGLLIGIKKNNMTTKIYDPLVSLITEGIDTKKIISSYFPEWWDVGQNVHCPEHNDNLTLSFHIDPSGKAFCHGCGFSFSNIISLVSYMEGLSYYEVRSMLYREVVNGIPDSKVDAFVKTLWRKSNKSKLLYLIEKRGLTEDIIKRFKIGLEPKAKSFTIPIYDRYGACRNIRYMNHTKKCKAINERGFGEVRLFPEPDLVLEKKVVLVEGEYDCLVGRCYGLPTITWTGGCTSWNDSIGELLRGRIVWLCYDNDEAGQRGMRLIRSKLSGMADVIDVDPPDRSKGKDITDWHFSCPEFLKKLSNSVKGKKISSVDLSKKKICPTCGQEIK